MATNSSNNNSIDKVESDKYFRLGEDIALLFQPLVNKSTKTLQIFSDASSIYNTYLVNDVNSWQDDCFKKNNTTDISCGYATRKLSDKLKAFLDGVGLGEKFEFKAMNKDEKTNIDKLKKLGEQEKKAADTEGFMNISGNNSLLDIGNILLVLLILFILFILTVNKSLLTSVNSTINFKNFKNFFNKKLK